MFVQKTKKMITLETQHIRHSCTRSEPRQKNSILPRMASCMNVLTCRGNPENVIERDFYLKNRDEQKIIEQRVKIKPTPKQRENSQPTKIFLNKQTSPEGLCLQENEDRTHQKIVEPTAPIHRQVQESASVRSFHESEFEQMSAPLEEDLYLEDLEGKTSLVPELPDYEVLYRQAIIELDQQEKIFHQALGTNNEDLERGNFYSLQKHVIDLGLQWIFTTATSLQIIKELLEQKIELSDEACEYYDNQVKAAKLAAENTCAISKVLYESELQWLDSASKIDPDGNILDLQASIEVDAIKYQIRACSGLIMTDTMQNDIDFFLKRTNIQQYIEQQNKLYAAEIDTKDKLTALDFLEKELTESWDTSSLQKRRDLFNTLLEIKRAGTAYRST